MLESGARFVRTARTAVTARFILSLTVRVYELNGYSTWSCGRTRSSVRYGRIGSDASDGRRATLSAKTGFRFHNTPPRPLEEVEVGVVTGAVVAEEPEADR